MTNPTPDLEQRTEGAPRVRAGVYLLYAMKKEGFEEIKPILSGDDFFFHEPSKYPQPTSEVWPPSRDKYLHVWMHFSHLRDSGASRILDKMSPDKTGEMKFLDALNTGISITMDAQGKYVLGSHS